MIAEPAAWIGKGQVQYVNIGSPRDANARIVAAGGPQMRPRGHAELTFDTITGELVHDDRRRAGTVDGEVTGEDRRHDRLRLAEGLNVGTVADRPVAIAAYSWANRLVPAGLDGRAPREAHVMFLVCGALLADGFLHPARRAHGDGHRRRAAAVRLAERAAPIRQRQDSPNGLRGTDSSRRTGACAD